MTVLHISYATTWGGGERQMIDLIHSLNTMGISNPLLCPANSALAAYAQKNKLLFTPITDKKIKTLKRHIISTKVDIIHIHTGSFIKDFIGLSLFYGIKKPTIYTINGIMRKKSFFSKLKYNIRFINAYHFVSKAAKFHFENEVAFPRNVKKLHVIYDGIQTTKVSTNKRIDEMLMLPKNAVIIGNIANHTRAKNLISFCKIALHIVNEKQQKHFHFVQIGRKTKLTEELDTFLSENQLQENVHFLDFQPEAEALMTQFDVLAMTSNREGLPLTIMEAFKYKVPVVTTNAGGIPEAILHTKTGMMADVDDHKTLAHHILEFLENPTLVEQITVEAHNLFKTRFTATRMGQDTMQLYKKMLDEF